MQWRVGGGGWGDGGGGLCEGCNAVLGLPAEYYLDTVKTVFQEFALPRGRMFVREELVRPHAIREPALLTIEGELDDISGNGQTEAAHALCLNIPRERRAALFSARGGGHGAPSRARRRQVGLPRAGASSSPP